ncbi:MAG: NAD-dependent epimerase/dehydratase family protein [Mogibacterium sp.]|nr:NAD-dependent epimerase/dehydratase family protein [Mogibacterium sp.]
MKICVIGGNGQIGNYLLPMLIQEGHEVFSVNRGKTRCYRDCPEFAQVREVRLDRSSADFDKEVASLGCDVIVDMICFTEAELTRLVREIRGTVSHYLVIGSMWIHGTGDAVPVREEECREPMEEYGRNKLAISETIRRLWQQEGFPGTVIHPGHIIAPGHSLMIGPQGNRDMEIVRKLRDGETVLLPNFGLETVHHVHAEDVAGILLAAIHNRDAALGEEFHAVSERAVTLRGFCRMVAGFYGQTAHLEYLPYEEFARTIREEDAKETYEHISHSPSGSPEKTTRVLGYRTRSTEQTVREHLEALGWL